MPTHSFNKKYKVHPSAADDFMKELMSAPKKSAEERVAMKSRIDKNNKLAAEALKKFSAFNKENHIRINYEELSEAGKKALAPSPLRRKFKRNIVSPELKEKAEKERARLIKELGIITE